MKVPKFLLADNSEMPEDLFIIHSEYPRFVLSMEDEAVEWWDEIDEEEELTINVTELIDQAYAFYENEMDKYEDEDED